MHSPANTHCIFITNSVFSRVRANLFLNEKLFLVCTVRDPKKLTKIATFALIVRYIHSDNK